MGSACSRSPPRPARRTSTSPRGSIGYVPTNVSDGPFAVSPAAAHPLAELADILCCPTCGADLVLYPDHASCAGCGRDFDSADGIPLLFWPTDWAGAKRDVTDVVKAFYEETPFPNYDEFDSAASLAQKARRGMFAKMLDDQVPPGTMVLECGCGTGQLSNFLSIANRTLLGTDICLNSLRLGERFRRENALAGAHFLQMNLFRPVFKPATFDLVIANGVLHHTADPLRAFKSIARLVKPGGYILIGLYHRWGRLITDARRLLFRLTGDRLAFLDPNLRRGGFAPAKRRAWLMDQYKHPHESKHTIAEVMHWVDETGLRFVRSIPSTKAFQFSSRAKLFQPEAPAPWLERTLVEWAQVFRGSREGGFFIVTARRPAERGDRQA